MAESTASERLDPGGKAAAGRKFAGVSPTRPDPAAGHWVRDAEGRIAGPWEEPAALADISAKVMGPRLTIDYDALCDGMQDLYLRYGITT